MVICVLFIAFVLIIYSEARDDNDEELFRMKYRQVEGDDQSADSQTDSSDEEIENKRRKSSQCEPCGTFRRPCCFPNLCQHRSPKISKCYKTNK